LPHINAAIFEPFLPFGHKKKQGRFNRLAFEWLNATFIHPYRGAALNKYRYKDSIQGILLI